MKIVILTDSYGGPRLHNGVSDVKKEETYPELVKKNLPAHEVIIHYESFRRLIHLPALLEQYKEADLYILQAGIVDLYPRPLTYGNTISQDFFIKVLRRLVRLNRRFVVNYIYKKPWSTEAQVRKAIQEVCKKVSSKILWLNIPPVNKLQNYKTPGANAAIQWTNEILHEEINKYKNSSELDLYTKFTSMPDYEHYLHANDSHLNVKGNMLYAVEILNFLNSTSWLKES
ncbi:MAG TPA: hypothetical protein VNB90_09030 [Cytophagaceae bacterium]|jgi:hypothetical protein|nr:hypothetical protein [Cytophagaceae bacterium]